MSNPYIGEIRVVAFNFAANGWAFCDGAIQAISQNETLFNLIGTTFGGDGQSTFGLPDLRGRVPIHQGTDTFGNPYTLGQMAGSETITLTTNQIPSHTHPAQCSTDPGTSADPTGQTWAACSLNQYSSAQPTVPMNPTSTTTGGGQPHENRMPFLAINFMISLFGIFPTQN